MYWQDSTAFYVNHEGYLYAANADITGKITADGGKFGLLTIGTDSIYLDSDTTSLSFGQSGWIVAQNLEIKDIFKTKELHAAKICGRNEDSASISFESSDVATENVTVTWSMISAEEEGDAQCVITCTPALTEAKRIEFHVVYGSKDGKTFTFQTHTCNIPSGTENYEVSVPFMVRAGSGLIKTKCYMTIESYVSPANFYQEKGYTLPAITAHGNVSPDKENDGYYQLGSENARWSQIFCVTGEINTSDANEKNSILPLSEKYGEFFDLLKPVTFKFNNSNSGRVHSGLIAQDVKQAINEVGLTTEEFAGYCEWKKDDDSIGCGLRYIEFIALCVDQIQKLKKRVSELENKLLLIEKKENEDGTETNNP
jgi:hypothetical protein